MNILEIKHLQKSFGSHAVIRDLNLSVPEHSVFGFVGQNGSGKTTTMKMVLGLINPNSGVISVCGEKVAYGETKTNRSIGYLPDVPEFYDYMTPSEYLRLCGRITGMSKQAIKTKSDELLTLVGLGKVNRKIGGFSRGMKQRLGIAQALLNEPKLLICDEPTSALDPVGRKEILDILFSVRGKTTVIFSTHILSDVERICDQVAVLHQGSIALSGTLSQIKAQHRHNCYTIDFADPADASLFKESAEGASQQMQIEETHKGSLTVKVADTQQGGQFLVDLLSQKRLTPARFELMEPTPESLFMEVVQ